MAIWEAAGYPWSMRLKALLPSWMHWIRKRYRMGPQIEQQWLRISARPFEKPPLTKNNPVNFFLVNFKPRLPISNK
jgi:hypothetical protein